MCLFAFVNFNVYSYVYTVNMLITAYVYVMDQLPLSDWSSCFLDNP